MPEAGKVVLRRKGGTRRIEGKRLKRLKKGFLMGKGLFRRF
jgi:hypothetical protein